MSSSLVCIITRYVKLQVLYFQVHESGIISSPFHPYEPLYAAGIDASFGWQDAAIPFPRTSGATFCANGMSIKFHNTAYRKSPIEVRDIQSVLSVLWSSPPFEAIDPKPVAC